MSESRVERPPLSELVDRALAQDTRRLQKLLLIVYENPDGARAAFRARVGQVGARAAGTEMAAEPTSFGRINAASQAALASASREAGYVGGIAYLLQAQRTNPTAVAQLLTERFYTSAGAVFQDPAVAYRSWSASLRSESPHQTAARMARSPESIAAIRPGGGRFAAALAARALDAQYAREHAAAFARHHDALSLPNEASLPRDIAELRQRPGGRLPRTLELRLEAFTADFRGKLAEAYVDAPRAERTFHEILAREGSEASVQAVRRSPQMLGTLRTDPAAADLAHAAVQRGASAYELNRITNPAQAADLLQRETERSFARQCANPAAALRRIQSAIRLHGIDRVSGEISVDPLRYFAPLDGGHLNGSALAAEARELADVSRAADSFIGAATSRLDRAHPAPELPLDGTARQAVQAHVDALALAGQRGDLHEALNNTANALERAEQAFRWHAIRETQLLNALKGVFKKPEVAIEELVTLATKKGNKAAIETLEKKPERIAAVAGSLRNARAAAAKATINARQFLEAREALKNVHYTDPLGQVHRGAENVRASTTAELGSSAADLAEKTSRLQALGDVDGSRARAVHAVQSLSPDQADALINAVAGRNPEAAKPLQGVRETAAAARGNPAQRREGTPLPGVHHAVLQAAQMARTMGEGPTL